jgi:fumarate reductase iron-sulfur subunit
VNETTIQFEIFRYRPDWDGPSYQTYEVPYREDWVVLDALNYVKDQIDGSLSYRWSCRMGVCGSCGMQVNGEPTLTCATFLAELYPGPVKVEPLTNFPVERDLVIDLTGFLEKLDRVTPYIVRNDDDAEDLTAEYQQTPAELDRYKQFSMCINCMLCYAACPVVGRVDEFIGPAALALGQRYNLDSRDQGKAERQNVMFQNEGIWECTFVGECSAVCPKHVDPAGAIQQAKLEGAVDYYKRLLTPWVDRS